MASTASSPSAAHLDLDAAQVALGPDPAADEVAAALPDDEVLVGRVVVGDDRIRVGHGPRRGDGQLGADPCPEQR